MSKTLEHLRRAKALIEDPSRWSRGATARDESGRAVRYDDLEACRWCAVGALHLIDTDNAFEATRALEEGIFGHMSLANVNDFRGHSSVMHLFDKAIKRLEASDER